MEVSEAKRPKEPEPENAMLKKLLAETLTEKEVLIDGSPKACCRLSGGASHAQQARSVSLDFCSRVTPCPIYQRSTSKRDRPEQVHTPVLTPEQAERDDHP